MSIDSPYPRMLSSFELAGKPVRNHILHASIQTFYVDNGKVGDRQIQYAHNRAKGGAGIIVTDPLGMIRQHHGVATRADAFTEGSVDRLRQWATAVESEGCRLLGQIQDPGRGRHTGSRNFSAVGASPLPDDLSWTVPHELGADEIKTMVDDWGCSSHRLKRCGFSGVEISSGHGHLFPQFLSPQSNHRQDAYGGTFEGRLRILVELLDAIRSWCGRDFIVGVKLAGDDGVEGGISPALSGQIAAALAKTGHVDYFCFAQGAHHRSLEMHVPDGNYPRLPYMSMIKQLREHCQGVPVAALGRITDPAEAEGILQRGEADIIALGRALITDPAWPMKVMQGKAADIRYCVSGNTCWKYVVSRQPMVCDNNPRVGKVDEVNWFPQKAPTARRITIVGAGVSGLEAAWVSASRGHHVTLFGSSAEVGGKARIQALLPGGEGLSSIYDYQHQKALEAGVRFELGRAATLDDILGSMPDEVVVATGSSMIWPPCLPEILREEGLVPDLRDAISDLLRYRERQLGTAVVLDMDHSEGTYAAIELLGALFDRVVVITPRESIADHTALVTRQGIYRRLMAAGVTILTMAEPVWSESMESEATLQVRSVYGKELPSIENVAFFSYATPRQPNNELASKLHEAGVPYRLVGDCKVARFPVDATSEGHAAGIAVGEPV